MSEEKAIAEIVERYRQSIDDLDVEAARELWADLPETSIFWSMGYQGGKENVLNNFYGEAMGGLKFRKLMFTHVEIHEHGDWAWIEILWDFESFFRDDLDFEDAGAPCNYGGRESMIQVKTDGGWRIVHIHYSPIQKDKPSIVPPDQTNRPI